MKAKLTAMPRTSPRSGSSGLTRRAFMATAAALAVSAATGLLLADQAEAQSADDLKRQGLAGETLEGYLVARDNSVAARVEQINADRRQLYQQRAAQEGVSVEQIGKIYARQIIESSPPGTWYQSSSGQWVQK
jgi:uncharacterized protein YdbL (DUF1318 family)